MGRELGPPGEGERKFCVALVFHALCLSWKQLLSFVHFMLLKELVFEPPFLCTSQRKHVFSMASCYYFPRIIFTALQQPSGPRNPGDSPKSVVSYLCFCYNTRSNVSAANKSTRRRSNLLSLIRLASMNYVPLNTITPLLCTFTA